MTDPELASALDRADRALTRIERALSSSRINREREERLRARVREVVSELDTMIAGGR